MGGTDRKGWWRVARQCLSLNIMGGADLDLNDAELADDVVELTVFSLMGGADIYVPEGLNVEVSDVAIMGGNDVALGNPAPTPGGPTLRLRLISIMGGTDVKRGRKLSRGSAARSATSTAGTASSGRSPWPRPWPAWSSGARRRPGRAR